MLRSFAGGEASKHLSRVNSVPPAGPPGHRQHDAAWGWGGQLL